MTGASERQGARDILFLGGGGVVRALIPGATSPVREDCVVARQPHGDTNLGTARAGTRWAWAAPTERSNSLAQQEPSDPIRPMLRPFNAESRPTPSDTWAHATRPYTQNATSGGGAGVAPQDIHCLRAPRDTMRQMELVAARLGRSESEVWAEAAREWLDHRAGVIMLRDDDRDDEPPPAAPAALPQPLRPTRSWTAIDALLADLRAPADPSVA